MSSSDVTMMIGCRHSADRCGCAQVVPSISVMMSSSTISRGRAVAINASIKTVASIPTVVRYLRSRR